MHVQAVDAGSNRTLSRYLDFSLGFPVGQATCGTRLCHQQPRTAEQSGALVTESALGLAPDVLEFLADGCDDGLEFAQLPMAFMGHQEKLGAKIEGRRNAQLHQVLRQSAMHHAARQE